MWNGAFDRAKKKIDFYGIKNIELIRGIAEEIPFANKAVDLIVSNNGLNNVSNINKSLSECSKIRKQGGQFIQTINLNDTMWEFYEIMELVLTKMDLSYCLDAMHDRIYKKKKTSK